MASADTLNEECLSCFLSKHGNSRIKRELLLFWSMHPNARFDVRAICHTLDCHKLEAIRILEAMVEDGLLDKQLCNGLALYSLTASEERRRLILALSALGYDRWRLMSGALNVRVK